MTATEDGAVAVEAAVRGDEQAFAGVVQRHRRELHVHCYRLLGSFPDAEDVVQETFLRAWQHRAGFSGTGLRAWLYRIATNVALDVVRRRDRHVAALSSVAEVPWLTPYPDRLLDAPDAAALVVARETIELGFLAAMQLLPGRQRAVFVLRDVVGWSARETAGILDISVPAANSALQRARETLRDRLPGRRLEPGPDGDGLSPVEQDLLTRYVDAHERNDVAALLQLVRDDLRVTMPPHPVVHEGRASMQPLLDTAFGPERLGEWRLLAVRANRMPAAVTYVRRRGDTLFRPLKIDLMRVSGDRIAEFTTFDAALAPHFGVPTVLEDR